MTIQRHRNGRSEEIANGLVFIASDDASFITGHILNIDGGTKPERVWKTARP